MSVIIFWNVGRWTRHNNGWDLEIDNFGLHKCVIILLVYKLTGIFHKKKTFFTPKQLYLKMHRLCCIALYYLFSTRDPFLQTQNTGTNSNLWLILWRIIYGPWHVMTVRAWLLKIIETKRWKNNSWLLKLSIERISKSILLVPEVFSWE